MTVTLGSVELDVACDIAVPLRPHSNTTDMRAIVEGATMLDEMLMTRSPKSGHKCPSRCGHRPLGVAASLELYDVSREFPRVTVLKFSMSGGGKYTVCYKIGCVACL